ncbi:MAG: ribosome maturation factor RimP, partial [Planctomycetales bacterium]|nr:ribosome maturation factor RimP [Planctomycetales bacterium]NIM07843.1 ribosome maturation factor RimP [Planctomycetales bacterium]NIN07335.1 ribosome maturation factor RimP [Planctomycetales bacterium]NIN76438.1 ribosome maturation factor RimP [Planctomycetales bacterium]NIP03513.1 ribosome maturation factor RimP [Planctomycetales bacterium]
MIPKESIIARVQEIAKPILDSLGLELIDVAYSGGGRGRALLRVFIDKAGG